MSIQSHPFSPYYDNGQTITATNSSQNATFTAGGNTLKITNATTTSALGAYVKIGATSQTATADDLFIGPGETVYVSINGDDDNIAYLRSGGTNVTLNVIPGWGAGRS